MRERKGVKEVGLTGVFFLMLNKRSYYQKWGSFRKKGGSTRRYLSVPIDRVEGSGEEGKSSALQISREVGRGVQWS